MLDQIMYLLVFPGLLSAIFIGFIYGGIIRKVSAMMQHRVGPPIWQPITDWFKVLTKENISPKGAVRMVFTIAPIIAFSSVLTVMIFVPIGSAALVSFPGDIIIVVYLLLTASVFWALAGWASGSPIGSVGAIREITQLFAYEFPFIISLLTIGIATGFSIQPFFGFQFPLAFFAFLCSSLGKLGLPPFHIPEAEQEISSGPVVEYSGARLGMFMVARAVSTWVLISIGSVMFLGASNLITFFAYSLALLLVITVIKTAYARARIDQAMRFYWFIVGPLAVLDFIRAILGMYLVI